MASAILESPRRLPCAVNRNARSQTLHLSCDRRLGEADVFRSRFGGSTLNFKREASRPHAVSSRYAKRRMSESSAHEVAQCRFVTLILLSFRQNLAVFASAPKVVESPRVSSAEDFNQLF